MKKIFLALLCLMLFVGCSNKKEDVLKKLDKKISNTKSYQLEGTLSINRGNDIYTYDVICSYQNNDYYRVSLTNQVNNHEQIILRNDMGVYVLTPSINKSFKFQSDWPYNNSQIYLLQIVLSDIKNDPEHKITKEKDSYIIKSKVHYANNSDLVYQKVYVDNDYNIKKVEILDSNDNIEMTMEFKDINYKPKFSDDYFSLDIEDNVKLDETLNKINDVVYPMYVPVNTYLTNQETIKTANGERVILTFAGDKSFMIVEETINVPTELETSMIYGEPDIILDTVGSITDYSVSWISNGYEYSLVSNDMSKEEMMSVASTISAIPVSK